MIGELFRYVNPIGLGALLQSYQLSKLITQKVLKTRNKPPDEKQINQIADQLGGGYFSHTFFISRWDVKEDLGLETIDPSAELWKSMRQLNGWYEGQAKIHRKIASKVLPGAMLRYVGFIESKSTRRLIYQVVDETGKVRLKGITSKPNIEEVKR